MTKQKIHLEYRDRIAVLTIDRPQRKNTFNAFMYEELERVVSELKKNLPRVAVITGAGRDAFSAGFDVNPDNPIVADLIDALETGHRDPVEKAIERIRRAVDPFIDLPVPLIAAINGDAYGGGAELAVRCDLRVMAADAVICFSEVKLGLMPDWGGTASLSRLIGPSMASDLILTGRQVKAEEALTMGLVNHVSAAGKALETAMAIAAKIAANGPHAVRLALAVIRSTHDLSLSQALELEKAKAVELITTGECVRGISTFLAKQPPEFPDPED